MSRKRHLRLAACIFPVLAVFGPAYARQTSGEITAVHSEPSLGLTFSYPAAMVPSTSEPTESNRCLHLLWSVNTQKNAFTVGEASFSLFELDSSCVPKGEWANRDRLLASLTKALYAQPGAQPIGSPLIYDYGGELSKQRIHMAAVKRDQKHLLQMNFATFVHDRALLWVIQSTEVEGLNQLAKMPVSFDGKSPIPLFPASIEAPKTVQTQP